MDTIHRNRYRTVTILQRFVCQKGVTEGKRIHHPQVRGDTFEDYQVEIEDWKSPYLSTLVHFRLTGFVNVEVSRMTEVLARWAIKTLSIRSIFNNRLYVQVSLVDWVEFNSQYALRAKTLTGRTYIQHDWWLFAVQLRAKII